MFICQLIFNQLIIKLFFLGGGGDYPFSESLKFKKCAIKLHTTIKPQI